MTNDPMKWKVMAQAQQARNKELREELVAGSPWLTSMREAVKLYDEMQKSNKEAE